MGEVVRKERGTRGETARAKEADATTGAAYRGLLRALAPFADALAHSTLPAYVTQVPLPGLAVGARPRDPGAEDPHAGELVAVFEVPLPALLAAREELVGLWATRDGIAALEGAAASILSVSRALPPFGGTRREEEAALMRMRELAAAALYGPPPGPGGPEDRPPALLARAEKLRGALSVVPDYAERTYPEARYLSHALMVEIPDVLERALEGPDGGPEDEFDDPPF